MKIKKYELNNMNKAAIYIGENAARLHDPLPVFKQYILTHTGPQGDLKA
ncbi:MULTISPECIES: hypothetical protein [Methylobacter]|nr:MULTISPECIES: hypothetical protein [Methylobacter]